MFAAAKRITDQKIENMAHVKMHDPRIASSKTAENSEEGESTPRYDVSIFETPFSSLPNPKRVWLGAPSSAVEGRGKHTP